MGGPASSEYRLPWLGVTGWLALRRVPWWYFEAQLRIPTKIGRLNPGGLLSIHAFTVGFQLTWGD